MHRHTPCKIYELNCFANLLSFWIVSRVVCAGQKFQQIRLTNPPKLIKCASPNVSARKLHNTNANIYYRFFVSLSFCVFVITNWNEHWNERKKKNCKKCDEIFKWPLTKTKNKYCSVAGFPFYTIGRFLNTPCQGKNQLLGTCVLSGECRNSGGIAAGSCSARQAVCCICRLNLVAIFFVTRRK